MAYVATVGAEIAEREALEVGVGDAGQVERHGGGSGWVYVLLVVCVEEGCC